MDIKTKLDGFVVLVAPIKAHKIKALLGRSFVFAQTLSPITDGDKVLAHLNQPEID